MSASISPSASPSAAIDAYCELSLVGLISTQTSVFMTGDAGMKQIASGGARYRDRILYDGAVGYWRLGDVVGSGTAADSSGNAYHGSVGANVTLGVAGALSDRNTAALFDGGVDAEILISAARPPIAAHPTIEMWVRCDAVDPVTWIFHYLWSSNAALSYPTEFAISASSRRLAFFINYTDLTPGWIVTTYALTLGLWYHVALTFDGTDVKVYANGSEVYSANTWAGRTIINAGSTGGVRTIGSQGPGDSNWNGAIDEVGIYSAALSATQLAAHYDLRTDTDSLSVLNQTVIVGC
jgi:hypothetical protein